MQLFTPLTHPPIQDQELLSIFNAARDAIYRSLKRDPWYVDANMHKGTVQW